MMVTRYDPALEHNVDGSSYPGMEEHAYGDYVRYEDYDKLADEKKDLEKRMQKIFEALNIALLEL